MLTVGSLFAGIGGFDLAAERVGFQVKWQVEIDDYATRVLAKHWPDVRRFRDVRSVHADCSDRVYADCSDCLPRVDIICGGFPCQPVSETGARLGPEDERWLWPEFKRLIGELRPRYVVLENVPGLFTLGFDQVLSDLAALGCDAEWECLPSAAFGTPHRRERIVLVAYPKRGGPQGGILECAEPPASLFAPRYRGRFGHEHGEAWNPEPDVALLAHGLPAELVECAVRALGNSVVPQVAEWIFRRIAEAEGCDQSNQVTTGRV